MSTELTTYQGGADLIPAEGSTAGVGDMSRDLGAGRQGGELNPEQVQLVRRIESAVGVRLTAEKLAQVDRLVDAHKAALDEAHRSEMARTLQREWGASYTDNVNAIGHYLGSLPGNLGAEIQHARDWMGRAICNKPEVLRGLLEAARKAAQAKSAQDKPAPRSPREVPAARDARLQEIESQMGDRSSAYWRGPKASDMQAEYLALQRGEAPPAGDPNVMILVRLAELEKLMGNRGSKYWRGSEAEALQAEYRELCDRANGRL
jgi:hypothetical protein